MTAYRVVWEVDVDADTPREAAEKAREIQMQQISPDATPGVFDVWDDDANMTRVDLAEPEPT